MRVLVQRVSRAGVSAAGSRVSEIGKGLVLLVGVGAEDAPEDAAALAGRCAHLRVFEDEAGRMNRSVLEAGGEILAISQFTLYGDARRGRRPSFTEAAPPDRAEPLYESFVAHLRGMGLRVGTGIFGAHMEVEIHNDGPVTIMVESRVARL